MLIGQAAGVLAATCAKENISIKKVSVRKIQSILLENEAYLMSYCDVKPNHPFFDAIQRIGATGILRGRGDAGLTTSKTWFDPDSMVTMKTFYEAFLPFTNEAAPSLSPAIPENLSNTPNLLKTTEIIEMLWSLAKVMDIELDNYEILVILKNN